MNIIHYENPEDIQKYIWCMEEIKLRTVVLENILGGKISTGQFPTDIECVALQFRKILELIALGSLCANKEVYSKKRLNFFKDWNGKRIIDDLEKVNPQFYPKPSKQILDEKTGRVIKIEPITDEYLSKNFYIELYDTSSKLLHSFNPYDDYPDLNMLKADFSVWKNRIVNLLNHHQIQLVDSNKQLWVIMREKNDGKVHVFEMVKTKKTPLSFFLIR